MKMFTEKELLELLESAFREGYNEGYSDHLELDLWTPDFSWENSLTKQENS